MLETDHTDLDAKPENGYITSHAIKPGSICIFKDQPARSAFLCLIIDEGKPSLTSERTVVSWATPLTLNS